ncbi:hypothetical protein [Methylocystis sp. ATCC 49242]|uniref:hypothetical protein n=1 Tax=Methylocystis sp. ATCC 49242 TaxID=622637 RepID=UPI0001F870F4|nr:hypothetical protein [Methylocystis sp. ATCC 49242]
MNVKRFLQQVIKNRWTSLIEDPTGFPDEPPRDKCWLWTGYVRPAPQGYTYVNGKPNKRSGFEQPEAKLLGKLVNPRHLLFAFHQNLFNEETPRLKATCGNPACVNPLHTQNLGANLQASTLTVALNPATIDWSSIFETIPDATSFTPEQLAEMTGAPLDAAQDWLSM